MDKNPEDEIIITALLKRLTERRLPRAYDLEKKVLSGGTLDKFDIKFLESVFYDAKYVLSLSDKHPEYQEMVSKMIQLYTDITTKALENERNQRS